MTDKKLVGEAYKSIKPNYDAESIIKNPGMGWQLYIDTSGGRYDMGDSIPEADLYWKEIDEIGEGIVLRHASTLYIRASWREFEPVEGKYIWQFDENFCQLLQGAFQRKLKLAFRIILGTQSSTGQAVPSYVEKLVQETVIHLGWYDKFTTRDNIYAWEADIRNPVLREKFEVFLDAFSKAFDDPELVDYIDADGLGQWGESHWCYYGNTEIYEGGTSDRDELLNWISGVYAKKIKNVLLITNYQSPSGQSEPGGKGDNPDDTNAYSMSWNARDSVLKKGFSMRRDGLGSFWTGPNDIAKIKASFPQHAFFGENAFHHFYENWWYDINGGNPNNANTMEPSIMLRSCIDQALELHANTFELRIPIDIRYWYEHAPKEVERFALMCGYRMVPLEIAYSNVVNLDNTILISHSWVNKGVGKLPNNNTNWGNKYKVAFALLNKESIEKYIYIDNEIKLGCWVAGNVYDYFTEMIVDEIESGVYTLALAIVDSSKNNVPSIQLAVHGETNASGWLNLGEVIIQ